MTQFTIDFETRSECNLTQCGAWVYAEHPSTEVFCMAVRGGDFKNTILWVNPYFSNMLNNQITDPGIPIASSQTPLYFLSELKKEEVTVEAHNAGFERAIWENIMVKKYKWPDINPEQWRCSMAKAASLSLPQSLEGCGAALNLPIQKDKDGHFNMLKMCKPRKPLKAEKELHPDWKNKVFWHEDPESLLKLFRYCIRDVDSEHMISQNMRDLSRKELRVWQMDQEMNALGIYTDQEQARAAIKIFEDFKADMFEKMDKATNGEVKKPTQVGKVLEFLKTKGVNLKDLTKDSVSAALKEEGVKGVARKVLEIRQLTSKASVSKYKAMVNRTSSNGRMKGTLAYHGARTGRWAGRGFQPQNLTKSKFKDTDQCIEVIKYKDLKILEMLYGDPMTALSSCIRGALKAAPGKQLYCADFKSIEGRVLAWLAGEEYILENYRAGKDPYIVFASQIYKTDYEEIFKGVQAEDPKYVDMRFYGKTGELACGYQGGEKAVYRFAPKIPVDERENIVKLWRDNRPKTITLWYDMERCALRALKTGKVITWRDIQFGVVDNFLHIKIPSGRLISYYDPQIRMVDTPWGKTKEAVTYMGINSQNNGKWERISTYGGKIAENITQAVSRDPMVDGMFKTKKAGYFPLFTVHDEIISETDIGYGSLEEFQTLMSIVPPWADGLPLVAEGWAGERYRK